MARRRRHYGAPPISLALGAIPLIEDDAKGLDIVIGALVGLVGSAGISAAASKFLPPQSYASLQTTVGSFMPAVTGVGAAAVLYYAQKGSKRAVGHAIGAATVGVALTALDWLQKNKPFGLQFSAPPVSVNLGQYDGLLVSNPRQMNGLLVNNPRQTNGPHQMNGLLVNNDSQSNMHRLGALSMGGDDEHGFSDVVALRA